MKLAIVSKAVEKAGPTAIKLSTLCRAKAPEILLGGGIALVIGGNVWTGVSSVKAKAVLEEHAEARKAIEEVAADPEVTEAEYSEQDKDNDTKIALANTVMGLARVYLPGALMTAGGITMIVVSHHIMSARLAAMTAAYTSLMTAFNEYRARVIADVGEEKEAMYRFGSVSVDEESEGKNGRKKMVSRQYLAGKPYGMSSYAMCFDAAHFPFAYTSSKEENVELIRSAEAWANRRLHSVGYLFYAELKRHMGWAEELIETEDWMTGWMLGEGDDRVDLRLYEAYNADALQYAGKGDSVYLEDGEYHHVDENDHTWCVWLDPNLDGEILSKISFRR